MCSETGGTGAEPVRWTSDRAIRIDPRGIRGNPTVASCAASIRAASPAWARDIVPSARSLLVIVDPLAVDHEDLGSLPARLRGLAEHASPRTAHDEAEPRLHTVPACYDERCAPDLVEVARELGMTTAAVAAMHAEGEYTVECVGFSPGFPYLAGLDPRLHLPRHASPRARVPAGSVAIAGDTTGVYPHATPGGWRLIGRTPAVLFDPSEDPPAALRVGDRVRFEAIGYDELLDGLAARGMDP
jgi:KipI family sensor histidine kinase inhibitor